MVDGHDEDIVPSVRFADAVSPTEAGGGLYMQPAGPSGSRAVPFEFRERGMFVVGEGWGLVASVGRS